MITRSCRLGWRSVCGPASGPKASPPRRETAGTRDPSAVRGSARAGSERTVGGECLGRHVRTAGRRVSSMGMREPPEAGGVSGYATTARRGCPQWVSDNRQTWCPQRDSLEVGGSGGMPNVARMRSAARVAVSVPALICCSTSGTSARTAGSSCSLDSRASRTIVHVQSTC